MKKNIYDCDTIITNKNDEEEKYVAKWNGDSRGRFYNGQGNGRFKTAVFFSSISSMKNVINDEVMSEYTPVRVIFNSNK